MSQLNGEDSPFEMKLVKFDEINNIEIIHQVNSSIKIKIYAHGNTYSQIYQNSDEKHIIKLAPQYLAIKNIRV